VYRSGTGSWSFVSAVAEGIDRARFYLIVASIMSNNAEVGGRACIPWWVFLGPSFVVWR